MKLALKSERALLKNYLSYCFKHLTFNHLYLGLLIVHFSFKLLCFWYDYEFWNLLFFCNFLLFMFKFFFIVILDIKLVNAKESRSHLDTINLLLWRFIKDCCRPSILVDICITCQVEFHGKIFTVWSNSLLRSLVLSFTKSWWEWALSLLKGWVKESLCWIWKCRWGIIETLKETWLDLD